VSTSSVSLPRPARSRVFARVRELSWPRPELAALLVLAAVLDLWALDRNGFANEYYSAAVRSMSSSWHAFLFGSYDATGVMTVDKPPLALWVQALSARVFGFGSWSMLVPQAVMGVATVGLTYDLVRRRFGRAAGAAAGLVLALTPITVAISRHNNPDALLVLLCTAALWFLVRGLEDGRMRWIVLSGIAVGLGFEAKMGVALMVVPGIAAAWLWVAPRGRAAAARALLAGGAALTAVGLAWPVLVWLTPASDRPWISGTADNSVWSLILGYNGLGRLLGQGGGPGGGGAASGGGAGRAFGGAALGGVGGPAGGGPGGAGPFGGEPGALRLFNQSLGGQAGWLLGFAAVATVALVVVSRLRRGDPRTGWLIAMGGAFAVTAVAFSQAKGIFHPYYVSLLAPFSAALVGAGVGEIARGGKAARVVGPFAVAGGVATELIVLRSSASAPDWTIPILLVVATGAAAALAWGIGRRGRWIALAAVLGALLLAPASWAVTTLGHATNGIFPAGGPASAAFGGGGPGGAPSGPPTGAAGSTGGPPTGAAGSTGGPPIGFPGAARAAPRLGGGPFGGDAQGLSRALAYASRDGGGAVAVSSQQGASREVIAGANVVAIGGFSGRESQVTTAWLADAVQAGRIRFVLAGTSQGGMPGDTRVGSNDVMAAVRKTCAKVSSVSGLYDCQGRAGVLRVAS
jgi:4-amino-4-deoxy-L-arabinose transferase-like glycosyltransferase